MCHKQALSETPGHFWSFLKSLGIFGHFRQNSGHFWNYPFEKGVSSTGFGDDITNISRLDGLLFSSVEVTDGPALFQTKLFRAICGLVSTTWSLLQ